jgi:hypothetical protein
MTTRTAQSGRAMLKLVLVRSRIVRTRRRRLDRLRDSEFRRRSMDVEYNQREEQHFNTIW